MSDELQKFEGLLESIDPRQTNAIEIARKVLDGKENVTFTLRQEREPQVRQESPPRHHAFYDVPAFVAYLKANKTPHTIVMGDIDASPNPAVYAVLDDRAPKGFETVELRLKLHPAYQPFDAMLGEQKHVLDLCRELLTYRNFLKTTEGQDPRTLALIFSKVQASNKVTSYRGIGKDAINGLTCESTARGASGSETVELPDSIRIACPIYVDTPVTEFGLDLTVMVKGENVTMMVTSADVVTAKIRIFDEHVMSAIRTALPDCVVGLGQPRWLGWSYWTR